MTNDSAKTIESHVTLFTKIKTMIATVLAVILIYLRFLLKP